MSKAQLPAGQRGPMAARQPQHLGFDSSPGLRARSLGSGSLRLVGHPLRRPDLAGPLLRQVVQQNPELVRKGPPADPPGEVGDDAEVLLPQLRSQVKIFIQVTRSSGFFTLETLSMDSKYFSA